MAPTHAVRPSLGAPLSLCTPCVWRRYEAASRCAKAGKHSTTGLGKTAPAPAGDTRLPGAEAGGSGDDSELRVPCGAPAKTGHKESALLYNEYVVYDVAQVRQRFALKVKFHFK